MSHPRTPRGFPAATSAAAAGHAAPPLRTTVLDARVRFIPRSLVRPLILSSGPITEITEAVADVTVRVDGREAAGRGSIYLSDLWSWPDPALTHEERDAALRRLTESIAANLAGLCGGEAAHPLELGLRLHEGVCGETTPPGAPEVSGVLPLSVTLSRPEGPCEGSRCGCCFSAGQRQQPQRDSSASLREGRNDNVGGVPENPGTPTPPVLARAMCASPFDAAIHDAAGRALGRSAFDFYREPMPLPSADGYFGGGDGAACRAIARVIQPPKRGLRAWYLVGKNDDMDTDVGPWIRGRGYRCFKIKILGKDNAADVARTVEVYRAVRRLGVAAPQLTVDTNEANPDAASVQDYFERLKAADAAAFDALLYFEQPTGRDITVHTYDWRPVARLKPVLLDEGLTSLGLMDVAVEQGWSGFALKTCKGHSFALVAAAWGRERGLVLALQDLTNPGVSMIHAAYFAAHVPTVNDVELNSPQFTPAANADWLPRLAGLFDPHDGVHRLPDGPLVGLGAAL